MENAFNGISNELEMEFNMGFCVGYSGQGYLACEDGYLRRDVLKRGSSNFRHVFLPAPKFRRYKTCAIGQPVEE
jgi:hypothetical protein